MSEMIFEQRYQMKMNKFKLKRTIINFGHLTCVNCIFTIFFFIIRSCYFMENVRTYVNHVRNICHLELANPLTKRTLLVIW